MWVVGRSSCHGVWYQRRPVGLGVIDGDAFVRTGNRRRTMKDQVQNKARDNEQRAKRKPAQHIHYSLRSVRRQQNPQVTGMRIDLDNGESIDIVPETHADRAALERFLLSLSPLSRASRYWIAVNDASIANQIEHEDEELTAGAFGFLARLPDGSIVGHVLAIPAGEDAVETAFEVADCYQNRGIGTALLERAITSARRRGFKAIEADVLNENQRMLDIFARAGLPAQKQWCATGTHLRLTL